MAVCEKRWSVFVLQGSGGLADKLGAAQMQGDRNKTSHELALSEIVKERVVTVLSDKIAPAEFASCVHLHLVLDVLTCQDFST